MNRKILFFAFVIISILVSGFYALIALRNNTAPSEAAFGITPPYVDEVKLYPGDIKTDRITILRSDTRLETPVAISVKAPTVASWLSFSPRKVIFKKGETSAFLDITINVPKDAKVGAYKGQVFTKMAPPRKNGVGVGLGGVINLNLKVIR